MPWWKGAVLYQVYLRSFQDSNGDGIGDLPGLCERLPYIASLGVDGLWIGPFYPSPMRDFGYDVSDFCAVDSRFGTLDDFDAVVRTAHRLGLKVLIDQVWSHTAAEHPWFVESRADRHNPKADWYVWVDALPDGSPPTNWQSWMGGPAWRWEPRRGQYHLHNFLPQMPDLNFHSPGVQDALLEVAQFWWTRGVDGFRLDTANLYAHDVQLRDHPPAPPERRGHSPVLMQDPIHTMNQPESLAFAERLRAVADRYPDAMLVGELGGPDAVATMRQYTQGRRRLHTAYSFAFLGARPDAAALAAGLQAWDDGEGWPAWAFSNHDVPRVASRWSLQDGGQEGAARKDGFSFGGAEGRSDEASVGAPSSPGISHPLLWMALLLGLRGTAFIYQGEELGLQQSEVPPERMQDPFGIANWPMVPSRDGCRTPMPWSAQDPSAGFSEGEPWLPLEPRHRALAVSEQERDAGSMLQQTRALVQLRRAHAALRWGDCRVLFAQGDTLVLLRIHGQQQMLLAFNLGGEPAQAQLALAPSSGSAPAALGAPLRAVWTLGEVHCTALADRPDGVNLHWGPCAAAYFSLESQAETAP